jgi:hypothetical protein
MMLDIADETAHRALAYVSAVEKQGHRMRVAELSEYMMRPARRPGVPGKRGRPERVVRTTGIERALADILRDSVQPTLRALGASVSDALDVQEEIVHASPGTPGTPPESIAAWLARLGWLNVAEGAVAMTKLGRAVLAHLDQESLEDEIPVGIVLNQGDELAEARVISHIASLGPCAVIDRFFSIDSLLQVAHLTQVGAVLVGSTDKAKLAGLETSLPKLRLDRDFEIRKCDVFHDRFVIPDTGPVWLLGTSLSGLGRRLSMMVELADESLSEVIRSEFHRVWSDAEPLTPPDQRLLEGGDGAE